MKLQLIAMTSVVCVELSTTTLLASVVPFNSRSTWESLFATQIQTETFNTYTSDILVRNVPIQLNGFNMTASEGLLGSSSNKIDSSPFFVNTTVNGTTDFYGDVDPGGGEVVLSFDTPIFAWGAEFIGTEWTLVEILDESNQLLGSVSAVNGVDDSGPIVEFVGFVLSEGMTAQSLLLTKVVPGQSTNDSWAMDDVSFVAVPEPTTFTLALGALCFVVRKRSHSQANPPIGRHSHYSA